MATNDSIKKQQTPGKTEVKKSVANSPKKGFMSIPEVRMLFYVLPVALVFATFTYLNSRGNSLLIFAAYSSSDRSDFVWISICTA